MNGEDSVIRFSCTLCGQKIRVAKASAGKKGKCPKCKSALIVPQVSASDSTPAMPDIRLQPIPSPDYVAPDRTTLTTEQQLQMLRGTAGIGPQTPPERKLPWLIDIFFYPANLPGLLFFGIVILIPLILDILMFLMGILAGLIAVPCGIINALIAMYVYWFLVQCIRDSGLGGIRAPETMSETPGLYELFLAIIRILFCLVVCAAPAASYFVWTSRVDTLFWILVGCGGFYYLMAILAVAMFDSIEGLNPLIVIPSIFSTFFQYCGLVVMVAAIVWVLGNARETLKAIILPIPVWVSFPLVVLLKCVELYLFMIAAHLLGRFFFKYQEKLNWDV